MRQTVSKDFYELIIQHYPSCKTNQSYMKFIQYILFGNNREDKENSLLKVPQFNLAYCENKLHLLKAKKYCGRTFLEELTPIFNLNWLDNWSYSTSQCRVVGFELPGRLSYELITDGHIGRGNKRVYLIDGNKYSTRTRNKKIKEAEKQLKEDKHLEWLANNRNVRRHVRKLFNYMMKLDAKHFIKIVDKNLEAVRTNINNDTYLIESKRKSYLEMLDCIEEECKPMYQGTVNSWRLFGQGQSILGLPREYRKQLCVGWTEFDMKSCQLSIVSVIWNIPTVRKFLEQGGDVWDLFYKTFGVREKAFFKKTLYSVIFGKSEDKLIKLYDDTLGIGEGAKFSNLWLIRDLFNARETEIKRLANMPDGKYRSPACIGKVQPYFFTGLSKKQKKEYNGTMPYGQRKRITSAMAQDVQMIEIALLTPIIDLAEKNEKNYVITLWQHDGYSVKFLDTSKRDKYTKVIVNGFNENLERIQKNYPIPTYLEYEHII